MTPTDIRNALAAHGGLCSVTDLADRWGVSRQRAAVIVQHEKFPAPVRTAGGSALWLGHEAHSFRPFIKS